MDASIAALLGALIGGLSGVAGQVVVASFTSRTERRRLAFEAGLQEWKHMLEEAHKAQSQGRGARVYPAISFIHFNDELIRLIDGNDVTPESYRSLLSRTAAVRKVVEEHTENRDR